MEIDSVFEQIRIERKGVANIHTAFRDYPEGVAANFNLYKTLLLQDGPLSRTECEWLAMETSIANECVYSYRHHSESYTLSAQVGPINDKRKHLLSRLAVVLSKYPWKAKLLQEEFLAAGFSKPEWQHAVMVVSYFNFANRCAHAQDVSLEESFQAVCEL